MTDSQVETEGATPTRRAMIAGMGAVGASALLAACGTDEGDGSLADSGGDATTGAPPAATTPAGTTAPTTGAPEATGGAATGTKLAATSDIPDGGGKIFKDKQVVVTQPAKGTFKAFTTVCPHQGCDVTTVKSGTINCPCHGSQFSVEDGSVKTGPADKGLTEVDIKVNQGSVWLNA
jgi:nitrite reductase/ring-hydroxylating ferredoxin subunit